MMEKLIGLLVIDVTNEETFINLYKFDPEILAKENKIPEKYKLIIQNANEIIND